MQLPRMARTAPFRPRERWLAAAAVLGALGATERRLFYGVDVTDESYYLAVPYHLLRGARPGSGEAPVGALMGILTTPFVWLYRTLVGTDGIVLAARHLDLLFAVAVALAVALALRSFLGWPRSLVVAAAVVPFAPYDVYGLSYNTLGGGLFCAGCFLGWWALEEPGRWKARTLAGLAHGLAVFAYPTLVFAVALALAVRFALSRGRNARRAVALFELPALLVPLAALAAILFSVGINKVRADHAARAAGGTDLHGLVLTEWYRIPHRPLVFVASVVAIVCVRQRRAALRWCAVAALVALPPLVVPATSDDTRSLELVADLAWLAPPLLLVVRDRIAARLVAAVWLPAVAAGAAVGLSSSNAGTALGIGIFGGALVSLALLVRALAQLLPARVAALSSVPAVAIVVLLVLASGALYHEAPMSDLTATVSSGPFAGLRTTPHKRALLEGMTRDLDGVGSSCRIYFLGTFPAGYLLTDARPDTTTVWTDPEERVLAYFGAHRTPDVAVVVDPAELPPGDHPLVRMLRSDAYAVAASRADYVVYRRRAASCWHPSR